MTNPKEDIEKAAKESVTSKSIQRRMEISGFVPISQVEKLVEALKIHTLNPSYGDSNWMYALREILDSAYELYRKDAK